MPADRMPAAASKLGLIWSFPALASATCFCEGRYAKSRHGSLRILRRHIPNGLRAAGGRMQQQERTGQHT
jgi:hypothetical protein